MDKVKIALKKIFRSYIWLFVLLFALDVLSKWLVVGALKSEGNSIEVIKDFFYITLSFNTGSAFSLGAGNMAMRIVFIVISWLMSIGISFYYIRHYKKEDLWMNAVYAMLLAGALGNLIDRTFYWEETVGFTGVIDFLQFYIFGRNANPFATFNIADASLVVGVAIAIVVVIVRLIKEKMKESAEEQARKDKIIEDSKDEDNHN